MLNSTMVLSGGALDAQETMEKYIMMSVNARRSGDETLADKYWQDAVRYEQSGIYKQRL